MGLAGKSACSGMPHKPASYVIGPEVHTCLTGNIYTHTHTHTHKFTHNALAYNHLNFLLLSLFNPRYTHC
jgi:hypothetical protein